MYTREISFSFKVKIICLGKKRGDEYGPIGKGSWSLHCYCLEEFGKEKMRGVVGHLFKSQWRAFMKPQRLYVVFFNMFLLLFAITVLGKKSWTSIKQLELLLLLKLWLMPSLLTHMLPSIHPQVLPKKKVRDKLNLTWGSAYMTKTKNMKE